MRMTKITAALLMTALAAPMAAPAVAQQSAVSTGEAQLAETLGVTPGRYSAEQLSQLNGLMSNDDSTARQQIKEIIENPMGPLAMTTMDDSEMQLSPGEIQMAELLGVAPGTYTLNELAILADTQDDAAMSDLYRSVLNGELDMSTGSDRGVVYPGKAQLAASLGVDPADYTTQELAQMAFEKTEEGGLATN